MSLQVAPLTRPENTHLVNKLSKSLQLGHTCLYAENYTSRGSPETAESQIISPEPGELENSAGSNSSSRFKDRAARVRGVYFTEAT